MSTLAPEKLRRMRADHCGACAGRGEGSGPHGRFCAGPPLAAIRRFPHGLRAVMVVASTAWPLRIITDRAHARDISPAPQIRYERRQGEGAPGGWRGLDCAGGGRAADDDDRIPISGSACLRVGPRWRCGTSSLCACPLAWRWCTLPAVCAGDTGRSHSRRSACCVDGRRSGAADGALFLGFPS